MNKFRITGYFLLLVGLALEAYFSAKLGMRRGAVEDQLRTAVLETEKAAKAYDKAYSEMTESRQLLASKKLGWGYEWLFPAGGAAGSIQIVGGRLAVTGLGTANGLVASQITDASGQQKSVAPVVHIFTDNGQGGTIYVGEFVAGIGPNELTEQNSNLIPTWNVSANEMASWNFAGGVRLRSQIPAGGRTAVESANQTIQRTFEQLGQTGLRINEQKTLLTAAEAALDGRKKELLGDPAAADNEDYPEYKLGLVQALENLEEERNAVQVAVDELRRLLKSARESRQQQVETLKQIASGMPKAETKLTQRPE